MKKISEQGPMERSWLTTIDKLEVGNFLYL